MPTTELARLWFVPGDGIERQVISSDIQRYLGNNATVRPGVGSGEHENVPGFWIRAYRTLTTPMIEDLKSDSVRWRNEQSQTGSRGSYEASATFRNRAVGAPQNRRDGESPGVEGPYGVSAPSRDGRDRIPPDSRMQIDQPGPPPPRDFNSERGTYPPPNQGYPDNRPYVKDGRPPYQVEPTVQNGYNRSPVTHSFVPDGRYVQGYPSGMENGVAQGYPRAPPSGYYGPVSGPYDSNPPMVTSRPEPSPFGGPQYQQAQPGRDARDPRYTQQEYAYPSPAITVSSVNNPREPIASPGQQSSSFVSAPPPQYDSYGNRRQFR